MNYNIENFLKNKLEKQYGKEWTRKIFNGYQFVRNTTLRVNTMKSSADEVCRILNENNIEYEFVDWYRDAIIIKSEDESQLCKLDIYEDGKIYLQSLSSMLPALILNPKEGENILDMTAAPGGKTTQMYNLSVGKSYITACEKNKIRAERLKYNLEKQGATKVGVLMQDSRKLDDFLSFDKVLLDAPCSGSGTLNLNDNDEKQKFSEELVINSSRLQKELLRKAIKLIKPGKTLIYSTCSILKEENEMNLYEFIEKKIIEIECIDVSKYTGIPLLPTDIDGTMCVCPSELYEGFFVAKIKRIK